MRLDMYDRWHWLYDWTERLKLLPLAAFFITGFHYLAGFSLGVSTGFGVAFAAIAYWVFLLFNTIGFVPYQLIIAIDYAAICRDFRLLPDAGPSFETITFVSGREGHFERSDQSAASRTIDIYKQLPCCIPAWQDGDSEAEVRPTFFFRPVVGGYEFGLHVQREWWAGQASLWNSKGLRLGNDNSVVLGFLPSGYIPDHLVRKYRPARPLYNFDRKQMRWQTVLSRAGWSIEEDQPNRLRHKYLDLGLYPL